MTRLLCLICASSLALSALAETPTGAPKVTHAPQNESLASDDFKVRATIEDPDGIFDPTVLYRFEGAKEFKRLAMALEGAEYVATISGVESGQVIEYFIEAFDNLGNGPALMGTPEAPFKVRIASASNNTTTSKNDAQSDATKNTDGENADGKNAEGKNADGQNEDQQSKGVVKGDAPVDDVQKEKDVGDTIEVQEPKEEGNAAGVWIGVGVASTVVLAAGAGVLAYFYFTREDLPDEVKITISAPIPVREALQ